MRLEQTTVRAAAAAGEALVDAARSAWSPAGAKAGGAAFAERVASKPLTIAPDIHVPAWPTKTIASGASKQSDVADEFSPENIAKLLGRKYEPEVKPQISHGIPILRDDGFLPTGIHVTSWKELTERYGSSPHRNNLLNGMLHAAHDLRERGFNDVYLGGSFVTSKAVPNDFDLTYRTLATAKKADLYDGLPAFKSRDMMKEAYGGEVLPDLHQFFQENARVWPPLKIGILKLDMDSLPARAADRSPIHAVIEKHGGREAMLKEAQGQRQKLVDFLGFDDFHLMPSHDGLRSLFNGMKNDWNDPRGLQHVTFLDELESSLPRHASAKTSGRVREFSDSFDEPIRKANIPPWPESGPIPELHRIPLMPTETTRRTAPELNWWPLGSGHSDSHEQIESVARLMSTKLQTKNEILETVSAPAVAQVYQSNINSSRVQSVIRALEESKQSLGVRLSTEARAPHLPPAHIRAVIRDRDSARIRQHSPHVH